MTRDKAGASQNKMHALTRCSPARKRAQFGNVCSTVCSKSNTALQQYSTRIIVVKLSHTPFYWLTRSVRGTRTNGDLVPSMTMVFSHGSCCEKEDMACNAHVKCTLVAR